MTASLMNSVYVAYYDVAARINNLIDIPTTATADIVFPQSARAYHNEGPERVKYIYEKMVGILIGLVLPVSIIVFIFSKQIVLIIAGQKYIEAGTIIRIAMLYAFMRPIQNQAANILNSMNKPKTTFFLNLSILTVSLILNYLLIKNMGFLGAAYGSILTTIFSLALTYYLLKKSINVTVPDIFKQTILFYGKMFNKTKGQTLSSAK
jgi:O-antigen/teichoic acid export membrane protein